MPEKLLVGLGNPGLKYKYTRHNVGFILLDAIAKDAKVSWKESTKFQCRYTLVGDLAMLKPQTFMNHSGDSVAKYCSFYKISPENLYIIHDELDFDFLKIKKQKGSSSAGHNGVEDIIEKLGTKDFWRVRVGIGKPKNNSTDASAWVLSNFTQAEIEALLKLKDTVKELVC